MVSGTRYQSDYLYAIAPTKYGDQQEDYLRLAEMQIQKTCENIQSSSGLKDEQTLQILFFEVLKDCCKARHEIAVKHNPEKAPHFGRMRALKESPPEDGYGTSLTPLGAPYGKYNKIFKQQIHPLLMSLKHDLRRFDEKRVKREDEVIGRRTSFEMQIYSFEEINQLGWNNGPTGEDLQKVLKTTTDVKDIKKDYQTMLGLKKTEKEFYERGSMSTVFIELHHRFPSPKTISLPNGDYFYNGNRDHFKNAFVVGTLRLEMNGKMYALSKYLTWLYQDYQTDPFDRMLDKSTVIIIHQDTFLVEETLQEVSKLFAKALQWKKESESLQELKNRVALFRFTYAHCTPCIRGDGAIGDWLETAIYRSHGLTAHYNKDKLACFEPLVSISLSRYLNTYDQIISVS